MPNERNNLDGYGRVDQGGTTLAAALDGLRIIDWSTSVAAAWCGRFLADFGADVILLEPREGHALRAHSDVDALFSNKRAVAVDFANPRGKRIVLDLVRRSDVLLSSLSAAELVASGAGPATLRRPGLIVAHVADAPTDAPGAAYLAGLEAATGILAALCHRDRHSGEGQEVVLDAVEALAGVTFRVQREVVAPFVLSETPWARTRGMARPGEHSFDVLRTVAGVTDDHLMSHFESGVIGTVEP